MKTMNNKLFILYDARAFGGVGTGDASVFCTASTEAEAAKDARMFGETACYEYETSGKKLINEKWLWDTNENGKRVK